MKFFQLTIDYELFLGAVTGSVSKCMIEPTRKLADILAKNQSKMTLFWDVLHYYKLLEFQEQFPALSEDIRLIKEQIQQLAMEGHDIQLHLHPHWLDAVYDGTEWRFMYDRFKLQKLLVGGNSNDINTIEGCVSITKQLIENIVGEVTPNHVVDTFRAGGYLIQPFEPLRAAFKSVGIKIDSSTCPGLSNENDIFSFDFNYFPDKIRYKFTNDPRVETPNGEFIEIPITTLWIPSTFRGWFKYLKTTKYKELESGRAGSGSGMTTGKKSKSKFNKVMDILFSGHHVQLTTDGNFKEIIRYLMGKAGDGSTMILHPKLLNNHTLDVLKESIESGNFKFRSIKQFIEQN